MKIYILFTISFLLISACSTYYTDDELISMSNKLSKRINDIHDSLEKLNKDYIIFKAGFVGSTFNRNDYYFIFVKNEKGHYVGSKFDIFKDYQGKPWFNFDEDIEILLKCIDKDTIYNNPTSDITFLNRIKIKYKSKYYLFIMHNISDDYNKCVREFIHQLYINLFSIELKDIWK